MNLQPSKETLIQVNVNWLCQAYTLLSALDDDTYVSVPPGLAPHRVSGHTRHILEFYECFLDGVESAHIDYDSRKRDESIEQSRKAAIARIRALAARLETALAHRGDDLLFVRVEDAEGIGAADPYLVSSIARELSVLSSHTIHHFALIAVTLRVLGVDVDLDFGMAPSTLRYQANLRRERIASEAA